MMHLYDFEVELIDRDGSMMGVELPTLAAALAQFHRFVDKYSDKYDVRVRDTNTDATLSYYNCGKF